MKLEVGMYVRLENDVEDIVVINKIANVFETTILTENDGSNNQGEYTKENVVKASYNIVDILEVGDYVNGYLVTAILSSNNKVYEIQVKRPNNRTGVWIERIRNNGDIKSIVTKEQFENMKYIIGE
jgi:hypothetical protein